MLLTMMGMALAGPPADDLAVLMAQDAYSNGLLCTPASALYDTLLMGAAVLESAGEVWSTEELALARAWLALGGDSPFDRHGTLIVVGGDTDGAAKHYAIPFSGSLEDFAALAESSERLAMTVRDDGSVLLEDEVLRVEDGAVRGGTPTGQASTFPTALLTGLSGSTGCVLALDGTTLPGRAPAGLEAIAVSLPLDSEDLFRARLAGPGVPEGAASLQPSLSTFRGSSTLQPDYAVLLATDPARSFSVLLTLAQDPRAEQLTALNARLEGKATLPPGATVAVFGRKEAQRTVAVVPVLTAKGKPMKARKLMAMLGEFAEGAPGEWEAQGDDGYRQVHSDGTETWYRVSQGLLVAGDLPEVVVEAHTGAGEPWGSVEAAAMSQDWPVVVVPGKLPQVPTSVPLVLGLRFQPGVVELGLDSLGELGNEYLVGMVVGMAVPNLIQARARSARSRLTRELGAVVTAQIGHHVAYASYLEVPVAPRPVDTLGVRAVPWEADPAWEPLGLAPDDDLLGSYSVVLTDGGFVAHGWMDADGDGVPAHATVTLVDGVPSPMALLTPDGVY